MINLKKLLTFVFVTAAVFSLSLAVTGSAKAVCNFNGSCDKVGNEFENSSDCTDCDDNCDNGESSPFDCDGNCLAADASPSPDCEGHCNIGDTAGGADCTGGGADCDIGDEAGSVDCNGICDATDSQQGPDCAPGAAGGPQSGWGYENPPENVPTDIEAAIMNVTNYILGFIIIIATLVVIWGGVQYLTAAGNEDAVASAKKTISYGIIGMVIAGLAYAMVVVISTVVLGGG